MPNVRLSTLITPLASKSSGQIAETAPSIFRWFEIHLIGHENKSKPTLGIFKILIKTFLIISGHTVPRVRSDEHIGTTRPLKDRPLKDRQPYTGVPGTKTNIS